MENNKPMQELNPDQMEKVAGGAPFFIGEKYCPFCNESWSVMWSEAQHQYICSNPACQHPRKNPDDKVQLVL